VCANKANPNNAVIVVNSDYKPVIVSLDVKYDSIVVQEALPRSVEGSASFLLMYAFNSSNDMF
jgi:hypothetical protein